MPILWRYLTKHYLYVFFLSVLGFISVLLVTRFQDIARFAATGASKSFVLKFVLCQIPHILPLAIPISCLISAIVLFQTLSRSHELTALRVSGLGIGPITFPLIVWGILFSLLNFIVVSEISPQCKATSRGLSYQMTAMNPLCLLQKQTLIKLDHSFLDMRILKSGRYAEDVLFITRNLSSKRLGIMAAKKLTVKNDLLYGKDVAFISTIDSKKEDNFDHLVIENQKQMQTPSNQLIYYLRSGNSNFNPDYLNMRMLLAKHRLEIGSQNKVNARLAQEIGRRISLALAPFIFTLIGIAFGIEIARVFKVKRVLWATALTAFYLVAFISAKSLKHNWQLSVAFFLLPHPILLFFCLHSFRKIAKGAE